MQYFQCSYYSPLLEITPVLAPPAACSPIAFFFWHFAPARPPSALTKHSALRAGSYRQFSTAPDLSKFTHGLLLYARCFRPSARARTTQAASQSPGISPMYIEHHAHHPFCRSYAPPHTHLGSSLFVCKWPIWGKKREKKRSLDSDSTRLSL